MNGWDGKSSALIPDWICLSLDGQYQRINLYKEKIVRNGGVNFDIVAKKSRMGLNGC